MKRNKSVLLRLTAVLIGSAVILAGLSAYVLTRQRTLRVTSYTWSGLEPFNEPEKTTDDHTVSIGEEIELPGVVFKDLKARILWVGSDSITFTTSRPMSRSNNPGIDLRSDDRLFTVNKKEELRLVTPSMDMGDVHIFELIDQ